MIHLNLIDAAERESLLDNVNPVHVTDVASQLGGSKKKLLTLFVGLAFIVVAFSSYLIVFGLPRQLEGVLPNSYLDLIGVKDPSRSALILSSGQVTRAGGSLEAQVAAANAAIKHRESLTVKQVVGEINPQVLFNNKRTDYNSFLPMEKMSFQRASLNRFLSFLMTATPDDVGFSDCIYQAPNFFYVRGVAAKPNSQRAFLERLKSVSSNFKTPPLPENAPATDITAFGQYNVGTVNLNAVNSFVTVSEQSNEIKALKSLATESKIVLNGLEKPTVEDFGVYKRYAYRVTTSSEFTELQAFLAALGTSSIRVGVPKISMTFAKRNMLAVMRVEMFVVP